MTETEHGPVGPPGGRWVRIGVVWRQLAGVPDARRAAAFPRTLAQEWAA